MACFVFELFMRHLKFVMEAIPRCHAFLSSLCVLGLWVRGEIGGLQSQGSTAARAGVEEQTWVHATGKLSPGRIRQHGLLQPRGLFFLIALILTRTRDLVYRCALCRWLRRSASLCSRRNTGCDLPVLLAVCSGCSADTFARAL